jgi:hypothetical protein
MFPTATAYRARNVGKNVGNKFSLKIFPCLFNSLEGKFYSNSGSQIAFQGMSPKLAKFQEGASALPANPRNVSLRSSHPSAPPNPG